MEEFVDGREFTVLVAENAADPAHPLVYAPLECRFGRGHTFKHFELKWESFDDIAWEPVADAALRADIERLGAAAFVALGGVSYGRVDLRVTAAGEPRFLEMNPNCGLFYPPGQFGSADHILAQSPGGHWAFITRLLHTAVARAAGAGAVRA